MHYQGIFRPLIGSYSRNSLTEVFFVQFELSVAMLVLTGGFLLLPIFFVAISVSPHNCFFRFNFDFYVSKIMHL